MIQKRVLFCGKQCVLACDGRCDKAWGISSRPKRQLSSDPDDYVFVGDGKLDTAPEDPGTYEGECGKPSGVAHSDQSLLNKWCARECERSELVDADAPIFLPNLADPEPNMHHRRTCKN